jgi:hypothetical protein
MISSKNKNNERITVAYACSPTEPEWILAICLTVANAPS